MAKTGKKMVEKKPASEAPIAKTGRAEVTDAEKKMSNDLAEIQVMLSLKMPCDDLSNSNRRTMEQACIARYREFAPADATERLLASLSVGLQAAAMTSLHMQHRTESLLVRTEELKNAIRAAPVVMELLEALDRRRGRGKQSVAVGQVTVESGGQAIVGNVNSEGRRSTKPEETENPNDDPSREKQ